MSLIESSGVRLSRKRFKNDLSLDIKLNSCPFSRPNQLGRWHPSTLNRVPGYLKHEIKKRKSLWKKLSTTTKFWLFPISLKHFLCTSLSITCHQIVEIKFTLTRKALRDKRDLKETTRRQRGHGKTKDIIGRTIAQHVRLYISEPYNAKQQCEIPTICVVCEPKPRQQIILISSWTSTLLWYAMLKLRCGTVWDGKHMQPFLKFKL